MAEPTRHLKHKKSLPYVLCVEGNIGSGKSTLLSNLSARGFTVIEEPVNDIWGQYLPRLYDDLKRWGFCFQMEAMDWFRQLQSKKFEHLLIKMQETENRRNPMNEHKEAESSEDEDEDYDVHNDQENLGDAFNRRNLKNSPQKQLLNNGLLIPDSTKKVIIVERSALSAIRIFAQNLLDTGFMTQWEYSLLERFYSMIAWEPKHILYLKCNPRVCVERIQRRNRDGEANVDPVLIQNLHKKHELMFNGTNKEFGNEVSPSPKQNILIVSGHQSA
eukprot:113567_1